MMTNCSFTLFTVDSRSPEIIACPSGIVHTQELGSTNTSVHWSSPSATDNSGITTLASQSHYPGDYFVTGTTDVTYKFVDGSGNEAFCIFEVYVYEGNIFC